MSNYDILIKCLNELFDTAVREAVSKRTNTEIYFANSAINIYQVYTYNNAMTDTDTLDFLHLFYDRQKSLRNICEIYAD